MRALVVFESMYGNTRAVATAIAEGLRAHYRVDVVPVDAATPALVAEADLLVVGGPTHMHSLSRASTRKTATEAAAKPGGPQLDPDARGSGVREWLDVLADTRRSAAAAFDTRLSGPATFTGRAGLVVGRRLRRHGYRLVVSPESFIVDKQNNLLSGEIQRAAQWGRDLAAVGSAASRAPAEKS
jgi:flavodoxin-like protein